MKSSLEKISGTLIFLSFVFTNLAYFFNNEIFIYAGIFAWLAFIFLFISLPRKGVIITLLILSFINFSIAWYKGFEINFIKVFTINQFLFTLLIGVGYLKLIATPKIESIDKNTSSTSSFIKTYLGIHLFGSVLNLLSLVLVADKMYKKGNLKPLQIVVLTRAFSSDAFWSPFFVAFAAALTYVPNFDKSIIILNGLIFAFLAFLITFYDAKTKLNMNSFVGYPISFQTLYLPVLLAILTLLTNYFNENIKVIIIVALYSFLITLFVVIFKNGIKNMLVIFKEYHFSELPKMKMELSLFIVAGMFGISVSSLLTGFNIEVPFENYGWKEASITLFIFLILSFIGIHPIITIAIIGDIMSQFNHTLLAVTFLLAWSTTVASSPFSGLSLTMQSRYKISSKEIFLLNLPYTIKIYLFSVCALFFLDFFIVQ